MNFNSLPCSAYVNFSKEEHAIEAMNDLNGKTILKGTNPIRIEFYQRANRFMGGFMGLDRKELINNTHFRVLFVKGLYKHVSNKSFNNTSLN